MPIDSCIDSFPRLVCPLCRVHFDPRSIRRLHVDLATPQGSPAAPVISTLGEVDVEKEKLKARLISMVREGADGTRFGNLKGEAEAWLQQQTADDVSGHSNPILATPHLAALLRTTL